MALYPRSGSEEVHNQALMLFPFPQLGDAAKALDPNFKGGWITYNPDTIDWENLQEDEFDWVGDSVGGTTDGYTPPSKTDIITKHAELYAEWKSKEYQRHREIEYPSYDKQLDMQYWDSINGTTNWADAVNEVKTAYPKPN